MYEQNHLYMMKMSSAMDTSIALRNVKLKLHKMLNSNYKHDLKDFFINHAGSTISHACNCYERNTVPVAGKTRSI